jgi:Zn-dependent protease with chaperone function
VPGVPRTFYDLQALNRRKTAFLIVCFVVLFALVGLGLDYYFFGTDPLDLTGGAIPVPVATLLATGFAGLSALHGYYTGDRQVLTATRSRPADPRIAEEKQLINVVEEMSIAAGLPAPPVYVLPDPDPNAFAVGRDPRHASIAVTEGLLAALDREQLQGVVAHELAHVRNLDIRTMTLVAALYGGLVLLSDFAQRGLRFGFAGGGRGGRRGGERREGAEAVAAGHDWHDPKMGQAPGGGKNSDEGVTLCVRVRATPRRTAAAAAPPGSARPRCCGRVRRSPAAAATPAAGPRPRRAAAGRARRSAGP